ncbi:hypothetical protein F4678DRAFT_486828 [Xylaria arbuscula]|nr:hypothetical protein F4678DRAFT_486828 [Xylaria arbuscula]
MSTKLTPEATYSRFACIGAGCSGIGLGATLKRWYGITDIQFFERHGGLGGTWYTNRYPGCACDVPSALYSYSFEPNPEWTHILPCQDELKSYVTRVADKYGLIPKINFGVDVEACEWIEERHVWRLRVRRGADEISYHESQFLFSGTGHFSTPRGIDVPGAASFKGPIFHSSRWQDVDLTEKRVVVFGNGSTASQIIPSIVKKTKHTTQIVRAKHWIMPPIDRSIPKRIRRLLRWVPGTMGLFRFIVFLAAEDSLRGFPMTKAAARYRKRQRVSCEAYMRETAPKRYHNILIPDFEVGCKRRVFDSGYLKSLHEDNLTLTNTRALEILPDGVRTSQGIILADVIVLANGFITSHYLNQVEMIGRGGKTASQHWKKMGGATAYNSSVLSGFPNFFMLLGPNSATGHTSGLMAIENSINYALRVIKPILDGEATIIDLKPQAELEYTNRVQGALDKTVWNSGCSSWYVQDDGKGKKWNAMSYPWSQGYYWYRSLFPKWRDWRYYGEVQRRPRLNWARVLAIAGVFFVGVWWTWYQNVDCKVVAATFRSLSV